MADVDVRPSPIEGLGVFAASAIPANLRIRRINAAREITRAQPLREDLGERRDHCDYSGGRVVLLGFPDRHLNHSCDPNAYVAHEGAGSFLVARRDIARGEEITCDYNINISGGTAWPCRCGAARCSGTCVGDFFLLPAHVQREYRPLLADWFVRAHAARLGAPGGAP